MSIEDYLYACVEAGVALSGFAALALAIRSRASQEYTEPERILIATLIERGLVGAAFALAPILLQTFGIAARVVWSVCSGVIFVYAISLVVRTIRVRQKFAGLDLAPTRISVPLYAISALVVLSQLFNIVPVGVRQGAHWYLLAVTWLISTAGLYFWLILRSWVRAA